MEITQDTTTSRFTEVLGSEKESLNQHHPFSPDDFSSPPYRTRGSGYLQHSPPPQSRLSSLVGTISSWDASETETLPRYDQIPKAELALTPEYIKAPIMHVEGGTRHSDLTVKLPDGKPLYQLSTDSTWVYHETHIKDLNFPQAFFIKRHPIKEKPEGHWRYTIHSHVGGPKTESSSTSVKLLEIDTDPAILQGGRNESWSTRLIFRNAFTRDLDALTLTTTQEGLTSKGVGGEVFYNSSRVATVVDRRKGEPSFEVRTERQGIDPLLLVVLVYVIDDRMMDLRRRVRRSRTAGWRGIGKGPGAGLAEAYGLATLI